VTRLSWADVNWERRRFVVKSPKTARHEGKAERVVPIFAELEPFFLDAFEAAPGGDVHCCPQFRNAAQMYRKVLLKAIEAAAVKKWPKLFQNLRASRATELFTQFPAHVAGSWLGHSPQIALKHYLQTPEEYFDRATGLESGPEKAAQNPAQYMPATACTEPQPKKGHSPQPANFLPLRPHATD